MTRIKKYIENMAARFRAGTFARIDSVLMLDEDRAQFVRSAVDKELFAREQRRSATETSNAE